MTVSEAKIRGIRYSTPFHQHRGPIDSLRKPLRLWIIDIFLKYSIVKNVNSIHKTVVHMIIVDEYAPLQIQITQTILCKVSENFMSFVAFHATHKIPLIFMVSFWEQHLSAIPLKLSIYMMLHHLLWLARMRCISCHHRFFLAEICKLFAAHSICVHSYLCEFILAAIIDKCGVCTIWT